MFAGETVSSMSAITLWTDKCLEYLGKENFIDSTKFDQIVKMFLLMSSIDEENFDISSFTQSPQTASDKISNFVALWSGLRIHYQTQIKKYLITPVPDVFNALNAEKMSFELDEKKFDKVSELVLHACVTGPRKEEFVKLILDLSVNHQSLLMRSIQQIQNNPYCLQDIVQNNIHCKSYSVILPILQQNDILYEKILRTKRWGSHTSLDQIVMMGRDNRDELLKEISHYQLTIDDLTSDLHTSKNAIQEYIKEKEAQKKKLEEYNSLFQKLQLMENKLLDMEKIQVENEILRRNLKHIQEENKENDNRRSPTIHELQLMKIKNEHKQTYDKLSSEKNELSEKCNELIQQNKEYEEKIQYLTSTTINEHCQRIVERDFIKVISSEVSHINNHILRGIKMLQDWSDV